MVKRRRRHPKAKNWKIPALIAGAGVVLAVAVVVVLKMSGGGPSGQIRGEYQAFAMKLCEKEVRDGTDHPDDVKILRILASDMSDSGQIEVSGRAQLLNPVGMPIRKGFHCLFEYGQISEVTLD